MGLLQRVYAYIFNLYANFTKPPVATPIHPVPDCRFPLSDASSSTITLSDGRKLGYAQYGSPTGRALFYLHGMPGSRLEGAYFHDLGLELHIRIIGVDRPGMGWSSPHINRTLLDHAKDIESLAEYLAVDEYTVLGISGGGPYALACAVALPPSKLKGVCVVCGVGPPDIGMRGADLQHWLGFTFGFRCFPSIAGWFLQRGPIGRLDLDDAERLALMQADIAQSKASMYDKDYEVLQDSDILRVSLRSTREAFAQGSYWAGQDGKTMCEDWGFRVADIPQECPVHLWYGKYDTFVPLNHGQQIAVRLGGRAHLRVEDDGHASISMRWKRGYLMELMGSGR